MPNLPIPNGLGTPDLECTMLDIAPLDVSGAYGKVDPDDLFYGTIPELKYAQGIVGEKKAHITLLFGIHPSPTYRQNVDAVLRGWTPEPLHINRVGTFPKRHDDQEHRVIIGHVQPTANLLDARARLEVLDHTNEFEGYSPHITLAYVKDSADLDTWIQRLDEAFGDQDYEPLRLNYGDND